MRRSTSTAEPQTGGDQRTRGPTAVTFTSHRSRLFAQRPRLIYHRQRYEREQCVNQALQQHTFFIRFVAHIETDFRQPLAKIVIENAGIAAIQDDVIGSDSNVWV